MTASRRALAPQAVTMMEALLLETSLEQVADAQRALTSGGLRGRPVIVL